jgi:plasmid stabilization system protein ParE
MTYTIYISPAALNDISDAVNYYNSKIENLGFRFTDDVDENFGIIAKQPKAFSERYKTVRGKLLKRFPFLIIYKLNEGLQHIEVLRLFNTYQNPYWG